MNALKHAGQKVQDSGTQKRMGLIFFIVSRYDHDALLTTSLPYREGTMKCDTFLLFAIISFFRCTTFMEILLFDEMELPGLNRFRELFRQQLEPGVGETSTFAKVSCIERRQQKSMVEGGVNVPRTPNVRKDYQTPAASDRFPPPQ